jgi:hypothetical protein
MGSIELKGPQDTPGPEKWALKGLLDDLNLTAPLTLEHPPSNFLIVLSMYVVALASLAVQYNTNKHKLLYLQYGKLLNGSKCNIVFGHINQYRVKTLGRSGSGLRDLLW